jgi:hypothetical protein
MCNEGVCANKRMKKHGWYYLSLIALNILVFYFFSCNFGQPGTPPFRTEPEPVFLNLLKEPRNRLPAWRNPYLVSIPWLHKLLQYVLSIHKRLRSPGIDSKESILPAYVAWLADTSDRVVVPARQAGNRFLGP